MRLLLFFVFLLPLETAAQLDSVSAISEIEMFRQTLNDEYKNPKESPLEAEAKSFTGHPFFPIDLTYRILAKIEKLPVPEKFLMETTSSRRPEYLKEYKITFTLRDTVCVLYAYRNIEISKREGYEDYLFLPFTDPTNGFESYGGGRYIDLHTPKGDTILIDFNQSYNPYCAYSWKYSCPVPPKENALPLKILAGIKAIPH